MDAAAIAGSSPVFWAILIGYFIVVLGFGSYFARFNRNTSDFFFGGRRFSWWLITMSIVATGVGSHSFLKYSAKSWEHGLSGTMAYMNDWFFMPLFMFGWLPIIYFMKVRSIPEYFERRFNPTVRKLATIALLVYMLGYIGVGFATMAKTLLPIIEPHLGWDLMDITWVVALVAGVYITFGGQTAVIFTDLLQGFILLIAGLVLVLLGMDFLGGFPAFWEALPAEAKLPLANFNEDPGFNFVGIFWQDAVAGSVGFLFMNQGLIMRFMACRSVNDGRKAAAVNVLFALPLSAIAVTAAGLIGLAIATSRPDVLSAESVESSDDIFVMVTALLTTKAGFGFFVAAVTAALMSSVDTLINAVAAVFINDVYRPIKIARGENPSDKHYLKAAMMVSAIATVVGVFAAWGFHQFESLYEAHGWFHSTLTPPLVATIFLGIFWRRFTSRAAMATLVLGSLLIACGRVWPNVLIAPFSHGVPPSGDTPYLYIGALYNLLVCFGVGILVSLVGGKENKNLDGLTIWSVDKARYFFKGGEPNDKQGKRIRRLWAIENQLPAETISASSGELVEMAAASGDLAYVCDKRWWLGGLRSCHAKFTLRPGESSVIYLSPDLAASGRFLKGEELTIEKEF